MKKKRTTIRETPEDYELVKQCVDVEEGSDKTSIIVKRKDEVRNISDEEKEMEEKLTEKLTNIISEAGQTLDCVKKVWFDGHPINDRFLKMTIFVKICETYIRQLKEKITDKEFGKFVERVANETLYIATLKEYDEIMKKLKK